MLLGKTKLEMKTGVVKTEVVQAIKPLKKEREVEWYLRNIFVRTGTVY